LKARLVNRRDFLWLASASVSSSLLVAGSPGVGRWNGERSRIKAVAFDAFPIFDPRRVVALVEELFPGKGRPLSDAWHLRQFEYTWLRVISQHYADFWQVTEDALVFAARQLNLRISPEQQARLMKAHLEMSVWHDVAPVLDWLKKSGYRLALLSNFTQEMLAANLRHSGIAYAFEQVLSTDQAKTYKPDPRAYQLGMDKLELKAEEILFAAYAGWDAAGAKLFGYPTFWVNRALSPAEELGTLPDGSAGDLAGLVQFLSKPR
jgi:2-haloacid dehalogenase